MAEPLRCCLILDGLSAILCASIDRRRGMVRLSNTTEIRSDLRVRLLLLCASTVRRITMLYLAVPLRNCSDSNFIFGRLR